MGERVRYRKCGDIEWIDKKIYKKNSTKKRLP